jgi:hypothetical protein
MHRNRYLGPLLLAAALVSLTGPASALTLPIDPPVLRELPPTAGKRTATATSGRELVGLFAIRAGSCAGAPSGSYFRMVQPGGNTSAGPFVSNGDSPCRDDTYTPLSPGSDGGLATRGYQANPNPAFDGAGNGLAARITKPQGFFSVKFSTATNATDPQTNAKVSPPRIYADGSKLSGDVRSFAAAWNRQHFNQGSPKPDGSRPGNTSGPTGTFDAKTGSFTLQWASHIVGGPFNNFTGVWRFTGTFRASGSGDTSSSGGTRVAGSAAAAPEAEAAPLSSTPSGPLARTGGGLSTAVGLAMIGVAALPRTLRLVRRRRSGT